MTVQIKELGCSQKELGFVKMAKKAVPLSQIYCGAYRLSV